MAPSTVEGEEQEQVKVWVPAPVPLNPRSERLETIVSLLPSATEILFAIGAGM